MAPKLSLRAKASSGTVAQNLTGGVDQIVGGRMAGWPEERKAEGRMAGPPNQTHQL